MKKIISMLAAVAMMSALFVAPVNAATVANPEIKIYAEAYDGTDAPSYYKPGAYDVYKVSYSTAGIDTAEDKITALQIKFTIDDETKIADKSWAASKTSGVASQRDANGVKSANAAPTLISKGYYAWASVDGVDAFDWDTYPDGGTQESLPLIETLIYVTAGETVSFTYGGSKLIVNTYEDSDERTYTTDLAFSVNGVAGNVVTLGAPAPTTYTYTFKNADGTADIDVQSGLAAGAAVTAPTAPTVAGKTFDHWATSVGGAAVTVDTTASADTTYYAVYVDAAPAYEKVDPDTTEQAAKVIDKDAGTYTNYSGDSVTLTKNYAIARFNTTIDGAKTYKLHASSVSEAKENDYEITSFAGIEAAGLANFVAIIKGAPTDTVMELRAFDK